MDEPYYDIQITNRRRWYSPWKKRFKMTVRRDGEKLTNVKKVAWHQRICEPIEITIDDEPISWGRITRNGVVEARVPDFLSSMPVMQVFDNPSIYWRDHL